MQQKIQRGGCQPAEKFVRAAAQADRENVFIILNKCIYLSVPASSQQLQDPSAVLHPEGHNTSQPKLYLIIISTVSEIRLPLTWKSPQAKHLATGQKVLYRSTRGRAGDCDYHL